MRINDYIYNSVKKLVTLLEQRVVVKYETFEEKTNIYKSIYKLKAQSDVLNDQLLELFNKEELEHLANIVIDEMTPKAASEITIKQAEEITDYLDHVENKVKQYEQLPIPPANFNPLWFGVPAIAIGFSLYSAAPEIAASLQPTSYRAIRGISKIQSLGIIATSLGACFTVYGIWDSISDFTYFLKSLKRRSFRKSRFLPKRNLTPRA